MAQYPPPPDGVPRPGTARPGVVTAAGVLLIIGGAFGIIEGLVLLGLGSLAAVFAVLAILLLAVGALELYAGIQVLGLKERGRQIGMILAGVGALFALLSIAKSPVFSIINLAIDGFIIWALVQNAQYFTP